MSTKINLPQFASLTNEQSFLTQLNQAMDAISDFADGTLSREAVNPNSMESQLDMNGNRIINLPAPVYDTEVARKQDVDAIVESLLDGVIPDGSITNAKLDVMAANTVKGNLTGSPATPVDVPVSDLLALLTGANATFENLSDFQAATIGPNVPYVTVTGYAANGDAGPPVVYTRLASAPGTPRADQFQSDDGAWWELNTNNVTPEMFGAKGDGSTNDATAVQNAVYYAIAKNVPLILNHYYRCDSTITWSNPNGNCVILGKGWNTGFDFSQGSGALRIAGSYSTLPTLSGNVALTATQIDLTSTPSGVTTGSIVGLWNSTAGSWFSARTAYNAGEFVKVHDLNSNTINIYGGTVDSYTSTSTAAYLINGVNVELRRFLISESATTAVAVQVDFGVGVVIDQIKSLSNLSTAIEVRRCYDVDIIHCQTLNHSPTVNDEYGITISNCQNVQIYGGANSAHRHAVAIGGYDGSSGSPINVPNRFINIFGLTLTNRDAEAGDMHGNCEFVTYNNCKMLAGVGVGGQNISYVNCDIWSHRDGTSGYCVYGSEIRGGAVQFKGCNFYVRNPGGTDLTALGCIHLIPNYNNTMVNNLYIQVSDCAFFNGAGSSTGILIYVDARNGTNLKSVNVAAYDLQVHISQLQAFVFARNNGGTSLTSSYLLCKRVLYTGTGTPALIYPDATVSGISGDYYTGS